MTRKVKFVFRYFAQKSEESVISRKCELPTIQPKSVKPTAPVLQKKIEFPEKVKPRVQGKVKKPHIPNAQESVIAT